MPLPLKSFRRASESVKVQGAFNTLRLVVREVTRHFRLLSPRSMPRHASPPPVHFSFDFCHALALESAYSSGGEVGRLGRRRDNRHSRVICASGWPFLFGQQRKETLGKKGGDVP